MSALIEIHYLPCIAYFAALQQANVIVIERHEYFVKQSYRNRCHIVAAHGKETLVVPLTSKHGKVFITDIRIDYSQKWLNNHWRTIRSAYGKAPFFEYYAEDLEKLLFQKRTYLYDLNVDLLSLCLKWLGWNISVRESLTYEKVAVASVFDLRSAINPKNEENLPRFYAPVVYRQVFGNTFVANASIIDLIFCVGPEAALTVKVSAVQK